MTRVLIVAALFGAACVSLAGCGGDTPKVETYNVPEPDPLDEAKGVLTNYANGMPVTSEAQSFPNLVSRVREKHPEKADILDQGLQEILANPSTAKAKSEALLKQL